MLNINDIKPLAKIPDYSIYFYYAIIIAVILLLLFLIYLFYNFIQKRKHSKERHYFKLLKDINFKNPKEDAYTITTYGRLLAKEERSQKLMEDLWENLQSYKYQKDVPSCFSKETKAKFTTFMDSLDVR